MARGAIHAVVGENGAGKSTLVKILAGLYPVGTFDGEISVEGIPRSFRRVLDAEAAGIFLVPQEISLVPAGSVAENLFLNRELKRFGLTDDGRMWSVTAKWIQSLRIHAEPTTPINRLSTGQQQLISIARALSQGVRVLVLDEPTSSLTEAESDLLFERVRNLRQLGVTIVYISHRLAEVVTLADAITVMRDGRVVDHFIRNGRAVSVGEVVRAMVGRDLDESFPKETAPFGEVVLDAVGISVRNPSPGRPDLVHDASIRVRRGEVVGLFGALGSGTSPFARAVFGANSGTSSGTIHVNGKAVPFGFPRHSIRAGVAYLSGERKEGGILPHLSVASNISLVVLPQLSRLMINPGREFDLVNSFVQRLKMKVRSIDQPVSELSGGTQQKVLLARWLAIRPSLLVLDDPTRGIDVATRIEIYSIMNELAHGGTGIMLVSSDLEEIMGMADRILVMARGRIIADWPRERCDNRMVLHAATAGKDQ
jgi:ABC-type sugar transport system ATPase subunit